MAEAKVQVDLDVLQEIIESLGEAPEGSEKRKHVLTRDDILVIARIVQAVSHKTCTLGFTQEEVGLIKTTIKHVNRGMLAVGWLIIGAIVTGSLALLWRGGKLLLLEFVKGGKV